MIKLEKASVTYHGNHTVHALKEASIRIKKGEWVSILGPSGSGKTTLLNVIGGMEKLSDGMIEVNNQNLTAISEKELQEYRRNKIGYIFQNYRLFDQFSVLENVMIPQWPYQPRNKIENKAISLLQQLQMSHRMHHLPGELSGGEKQRTAIARALLHNPNILLCDEPTGNLDGENRENILEVLKRLHENGMTILLVTHDLEVAKNGSRQLKIRDGIVQERVDYETTNLS
ncbi:ABC transporter ATP-binding protein [Heyndrickxia sp. NPDC080065]|uniref:ABC transporter ATP-binding protein n=1 Tax=Heyndrickxia sp. NPDC080065 TaxID=3390568 RepID=UPI003D033DCE